MFNLFWTLLRSSKDSNDWVWSWFSWAIQHRALLLLCLVICCSILTLQNNVALFLVLTLFTCEILADQNALDKSQNPFLKPTKLSFCTFATSKVLGFEQGRVWKANVAQTLPINFYHSPKSVIGFDMISQTCLTRVLGFLSGQCNPLQFFVINNNLILIINNLIFGICNYLFETHEL